MSRVKATETSQANDGTINRTTAATTPNVPSERQLTGWTLGLTRLHEPIRVKRSGSVKGVEDGQDRQALLA
jgi:hypothetical protein